jgi:hypothetical protein
MEGISQIEPMEGISQIEPMEGISQIEPYSHGGYITDRTLFPWRVYHR